MPPPSTLSLPRLVLSSPTSESQTPLPAAYSWPQGYIAAPAARLQHYDYDQGGSPGSQSIVRNAQLYKCDVGDVTDGVADVDVEQCRPRPVLGGASHQEVPRPPPTPQQTTSHQSHSQRLQRRRQPASVSNCQLNRKALILKLLTEAA
nr:uncharacterized protein LOC123772969 [Procambarus clarkii]